MVQSHLEVFSGLPTPKKGRLDIKVAHKASSDSLLNEARVYHIDALFKNGK